MADEQKGEQQEMRGEIVAKGQGRFLDGMAGRQYMEYEVGQTVLFRKHAGDDMSYDADLKQHPSSEEIREDLVPVKILHQESILYSLPC